jgi:hypothetical protein
LVILVFLALDVNLQSKKNLTSGSRQAVDCEDERYQHPIEGPVSRCKYQMNIAYFGEDQSPPIERRVVGRPHDQKLFAVISVWVP